MKKNRFISICLVFLMTAVLFTGVLGISALADTEEFEYAAMVTAEINAKGGEISKNLVTVQFMHGDFDGNNLKPFTKWLGDGSGAASDVLVYPDSVSEANQGTNVLWRWQWRAGGSEYTVMKITAKQNMQIEFSLRQDVTKGWAFNSAFRFIAENSEKVRLLVKRVDVTETIKANDVKHSVHLAKNDTIYIVYGIMDGAQGTVTASFNPQIKIDTAAYDASKRPQFDQVSALQKLKTDKEKELNDKYTQMVGDGSVYSTNRSMELEEIVDEAVEKFADLSSEEELDAAFDEAVAKMEEIPTKAEEEAELQAFKDDQKKELSASVSRENYNSSSWKTIQEYISDANKKIDEAKTSAAVSTAVAQARSKIEKVQMKQPGGGPLPWIICGIVVLLVVIAAVVVVVIVLRKNKGSEKKN